MLVCCATGKRVSGLCIVRCTQTGTNHKATGRQVKPKMIVLKNINHAGDQTR